MSANNILRIKEFRNGSKFRVTDECIEIMGDYFPVGEAETLEEAVHIANKYMEEEYVEYGISISLIK